MQTKIKKTEKNIFQYVDSNGVEEHHIENMVLVGIRIVSKPSSCYYREGWIYYGKLLSINGDLYKDYKRNGIDLLQNP